MKKEIYVQPWLGRNLHEIVSDANAPATTAYIERAEILNQLAVALKTWSTSPTPDGVIHDLKLENTLSSETNLTLHFIDDEDRIVTFVHPHLIVQFFLARDFPSGNHTQDFLNKTPRAMKNSIFCLSLLVIKLVCKYYKNNELSRKISNFFHINNVRSLITSAESPKKHCEEFFEIFRQIYSFFSGLHNGQKCFWPIVFLEEFFDENLNVMAKDYKQVYEILSSIFERYKTNDLNSFGPCSFLKPAPLTMFQAQTFPWVFPEPEPDSKEAFFATTSKDAHDKKLTF